MTIKSVKSSYQSCSIHFVVTVALLLTAVVALLRTSPAAATVPPITSTLVNFDGGGTAVANQATRFDTDGNALDAEEGQIAEVTDPASGIATYVLIGESHACGFMWTVTGAPFCGFNAYTSTDLVNWTYRGKLFDPDGTLGSAASSDKSHTSATTWQSQCNGAHTGCFRPHEIYNSATGKWVLWFYSAGLQQYYVMTSSSPYGGFVLSKDGPYVDPSPIQGDHYMFVDPTSTASPPAAYIAHAFYGGPSPNTITIDIQKLNNSYDGVVGPSYPTYAKSTAPVTPTDSGVEAPAMFERSVNGHAVYYVTYSDPHCGYGMGCGTAYMWALSPTGPWGPGPVNVAAAPVPPTQPGDGTYALRAGTLLTTTSCGGQPTAVMPYTQSDGSSGYLFQSNLNSPLSGLNEGTANEYWAPLSFDSNGSIQQITCAATSTVSLKGGVTTAASSSPLLDQDGTVGNFHALCDIRGGGTPRSYVQTFRPGRTSVAAGIRLTAFEAGATTPAVPNDSLHIDVVSYPQGSGQPFTVLRQQSLAPAPLTSGNVVATQIGWSPRTITLDFGSLRLTQGALYGLHVWSSTTIGCYGLEVTSSGARAGSLLSADSTTATTSTATTQAARFAVDDNPISVSTTSINFGTVVQGQASTDQTVMYSNLSASSVALTGMSLSDLTNFGWGSGSTCVWNTVLAGGASCTIAVHGNPHSAGTFNGSLKVTFANGSSITTSMTELGVAPAQVSAPGAFVFGQYDTSPVNGANEINVGQQSETRSLTITNPNATTSITLAGISGFGDTTTANWQLGSTSTCSATTVLSAGGSCTLVATVIPHTTGTHSTTITVSFAGGLPDVAIAAFEGSSYLVDDHSSLAGLTNNGFPRFDQMDTKWIGGTASSTRSSTSTFSIRCACTSVQWWSTRGPDRGLANVSVDGTVVGRNIDTYAPTTLASSLAYLVSGLSAGATHTVTIQPTGTHNANATNSWVEVDGFYVTAAYPTQIESGSQHRFKGISIIQDAFGFDVTGSGFPANTAESAALCDISGTNCSTSNVVAASSNMTNTAGALSSSYGGAHWSTGSVTPGMYRVQITVGSVTTLGPVIDIVPYATSPQALVVTPAGTGKVTVSGNGWMQGGDTDYNVAAPAPWLLLDTYTNCTYANQDACTHVGTQQTISPLSTDMPKFGAFSTTITIPPGTTTIKITSSWNVAASFLENGTWVARPI